MSERRRKRALITRPQEDSADAAIALARRGITPVLAPMMHIEYATADIGNEVALAQAVLFTSRNGVRAFSRLSHLREVPVFAVGDSTAALARDNGFVNVESARGDSGDLARLTIDRLNPSDGLLFHAAGATVTGDLTDALNKAGFKTVRRALYEAKAVDTLADDTATALRDRTLDFVLFFSPRTGRIFADLVEKAGLGRTCDSLTAICLSEAVASEITGIKWRNTVVAQLPTTAALLSAIAKLEDASTPPPAQTLAATEVEIPAAQPPGHTPDRPRLPEPPIAAAIGSTVEDEREDATATDTTAAATATGETPIPVEQNPAADEDNGKPEEIVMTEAAPSNQTSTQTSDKDSNQTASLKTKQTSGAPPPTAGTPEEPGTSEMRDSAAALSATLAAAPPTNGSAGRSRTGPVLMTLFAVIVVLGAAYTTLPSWRDRLPPVVRNHLSGSAPVATVAPAAPVSDALRQKNMNLAARVADMSAQLQSKEAALRGAEDLIATLEKQANDLNARLAASEKAAAGLRAATAEGAATATENTSLRARIAALDQALATEKGARAAAVAATQKAEALATGRAEAVGRLTAATEETKGRIAGLEKNLDIARKAAMLAGKTDTIALAARKLRDALDGSAPFAAEMAALKDVAGEAPAVTAALAPIEALAPAGVATRSDLFARLPAAVSATVTANRRATSGGWIDRTLAKLTGFVSVRRIDGKGTGTDAVLARAEMAARRGDLAATVKEMSALTGPGAAAAATSAWLKAAQGRLAADRARAALDKIVLTGVAAGDPS